MRASLAKAVSTTSNCLAFDWWFSLFDSSLVLVDGWFIVFLYGVLLPAPTMINFCRNDTADEQKPVGNMASFMNPLDPSDDGFDSELIGANEETDGTTGGSLIVPIGSMPPSINQLAKIQREVRETKTENQELKKEVAMLRARPPRGLKSSSR